MTQTFEDRTAMAEAAGLVWPDIADNSPKRDLPEFPVHLLPRPLGDMAKGAADEIQAPLAVAGMLALPVAASALAGKVQFVARIGHCEHAMLWCWSCAASAERKTPVFNLLRAPLVELETQQAAEDKQNAAIDEIKLEIVENEIKALKKKLNAANMDGQQAELQALVNRRQELTDKPITGCAWVTSPTPEGLHSVMATNGGRVAVFSDEGGIVGILAGRYSSKGAADLDPFLSGYVGSPLKSPRASKDRADVPAAFLSMGLAVQPSVLEELGGIDGAADRGLIGRFLFAIPESLVGDRMYDDSVPLDPAVARAYAAAITEWATWQGLEGGRMAQIRLDEQALRAYAKFHDSIERRNKPDAEAADLADIPSWGGKIAGTTLRLAGLFHCYTHGRAALDREIDEATVLNAIDFTNGYLIPHAKAAFDDMDRAAAYVVERRILKWIKTKEVDEFRARDLFQGLKGGRGKVQKVADIEPALDQLEIDNYLRKAETDRSDSVSYKVNPRWDRSQ